jgi:hypothetical protein
MRKDSIFLMNIRAGYNTVKSYAKAGIVGVTMGLTPQTVLAKQPESVDIAKKIIVDNKIKPDMFNNAHVSFFKWKVMQEGLTADIQTGQFKWALTTNKASLKRDLNLTEKKYNSYVKATEEIGQGERLAEELGEPNCYIVDELEEYEDDILDEAVNVVLQKKPVMTAYEMDYFRIKKIKLSEKTLMDKYNIDISKKNFTPQERAVMSIIHLAELDKNYSKYTDMMKKIKPDLNDPEVQKSIKNAKIIMSDEYAAESAINSLYNYIEDFSVLTLSEKGIGVETYSKKDLEDLKIYAQTFVLPREQFLAEKWYGHPVVPNGKYKDRACAYILSLVADEKIK